jgi:hypothetical protein
MQQDYYQRTSYQCVTSYAGSLAIVLRCVRLCVRWYGSCISPPYVATFCPSSDHLVPRSRFSVLPNYFYGDAIFCRCVAVITAWSCIVVEFTKQRNAYLRLLSPWKRVYCCHNNACWEPHCRCNFLLQCGLFPQRHPLNRGIELAVSVKNKCSQLLNRKRWTKMDCIFEKLAFLNVLHSQYVRIHLLRFSRGRRLKVCKIRNIITSFR